MKNTLRILFVRPFSFGRTFFLLGTLFLLFSLSGCPVFAGLRPAGNAATVTFSVPSLTAESSPGRALFPAGNTLYLRTIGPSDGGNGILYGPYTPSGTTFSTTDIPAGSYANLLVIAFPPESSLAPSPDTLSFLSLPDADLNAALTLPATNMSLNELCAGYASSALSGPLTLVTGTNQLALTLVPLCGTSNTFTMTTDGTKINGSPGVDNGRFIKLDLSSYLYTRDLMGIKCPNSVSVTAIYVYGETGAKLGALASDGTSMVLDSVPFQKTLYILPETSASGVLDLTITPHNLMTITGPTYYEGTTGSLSSGTSVSFGMIMSPEVSRSITFNIANTGLANLTISNKLFETGTWTDYWSSTFPTLPLTIPPGSAEDFTIDFIYKFDSTYSTKTATLTLETNDPDQPSFVLNLTGYTS